VRLKHLVHGVEQTLRPHWLPQPDVGPKMFRDFQHRALHETRNHYHPDARHLAVCRFDELNAVHFGHGKIEYYYFEIAMFQRPKRFAPIRGFAHYIP
jgi:hypothetical protein